MNPGELRHRIEIWGKTKETNELHETEYKDSLLHTLWASIIPQTGSLQKQQANTVLSNVSHKIKVRYGAGKNIKQDMHIKHRGKRYDIKFILNPYYKDEWLEIFCEEVTE